MIKKITECTWDYASKKTHSRSATFYEASICVVLCTSLVVVYENILQKVFDPTSQYNCYVCKSRKLIINPDDSAEEGIVQKLYLKCEECDAIIEAIFENHDENHF
jgi:hypothetical protein